MSGRFVYEQYSSGKCGTWHRWSNCNKRRLLALLRGKTAQLWPLALHPLSRIDFSFTTRS